MALATFDVACMGWELRLVCTHVHTSWYTFQVGRALMGANRLLTGANVHSRTQTVTLVLVQSTGLTQRLSSTPP